jgi:hypothetical protein
MTAGSPWEILGLAATADKGDIRRAYAGRLKVVHPEDDAAGFQALRTAYEQAMAFASRAAASPAARPAPTAEPAAAGAWPASPEPADPEPGEAPTDASPRAWRPAAQTPSADEVRRDVHARYCGRLEQLLSSPQPPPDDELTRAVYAVFDPASLADVATHLRTESWLAALICRTAPRSDLIIDRAAATFGWNDITGYVTDPAIAAVLRRLAARREADRFARLEALLRGAAAAEENVLLGALDAVTDPRVIRDPIDGPRIEVWLARLLLETRPRSDPLMSTVTRRLAWDARSRQSKLDPAIETVAAVAAQIQPRPGRTVRRAGAQGAFAGFRLVAVMIFVVFGASYCVQQMVSGPGAPAPYATTVDSLPAPGGDQPASYNATGNGDAPAVRVIGGKVEITMASTSNADAYIRCDQIAASALQGCRVERSTMSDNGAMALGYVRSLRFSDDDPAVESGRTIEVHVHWKDAT